MKLLFCCDCGKEAPIKARRLCSPCYTRHWKTGVFPDYEPIYRDRVYARLMAKSVVVPETGCFCWTGLRTKKDYGISNWHSKVMFVHRVSYRAFKGEITPWAQIRHTCDNPSCWNPEHLLMGSQSDNEQDKKARGRFGYNEGSGRYNSKLTESIVKEMRERAAAGEKHADIAARFDYSRPNTTRVINRKIWAHVS